MDDRKKIKKKPDHFIPIVAAIGSALFGWANKSNDKETSKKVSGIANDAINNLTVQQGVSDSLISSITPYKENKVITYVLIGFGIIVIVIFSIIIFKKK